MDDGPANQISLHVPRMYRVAYRLLGDEDKAHEAVQEACLKALGKLSDFDGRATMTTWLHRITVNCAKDAMRSETRKQNAYSELQAQARANKSDSPAAAVEAKELSSLALVLVEKLPDDCRSAFALTQLDGYSYDEAAQIEGRPRGTMASRVFRAKKILMEQLNVRLDGRSIS